MIVINGIRNTLGPIFTAVAGAAITWPYYGFQATHSKYAEWAEQGLNPVDEVSQSALVIGTLAAVTTVLLGPIITPFIGFSIMSKKTSEGLKASAVGLALVSGIVAGAYYTHNNGPLTNHDVECSLTMIGKTPITSCSAEKISPQLH